MLDIVLDLNPGDLGTKVRNYYHRCRLSKWMARLGLFSGTFPWLDMAWDMLALVRWLQTALSKSLDGFI